MADKHNIEDCPQTRFLEGMNEKIDSVVEYIDETKGFHREMIVSLRTLAENSAHVSHMMTRLTKTETDVDRLGERQRMTDLTVKEHTDFVKSYEADDMGTKSMIRNLKVGIVLALVSALLALGASKIEYFTVKTTTTTKTKTGG